MEELHIARLGASMPGTTWSLLPFTGHVQRETSMRRQVVVVLIGVFVAVAVLFALLDERSTSSIAGHSSGQSQTK